MAAAPVPLWQRHRHERYLILESIGEGTYGRVSMAIDQLTNRRVAVKKQDVKSQSCAREFAFLSALGAHPSDNVAVMLDHFAMKGSDGKNLLCTVHALADSTLWHVYWSSRGKLTDERVSHLVRGVVLGLQHLHMLSVVHGDASLKNMLLTREDLVQVADFGAAHSALGAVLAEDDEVTTLYVRAPERLLGDPNVQPPLDVWAFGVQVLMLRSGECQWLSYKSSDDDIYIVLILNCLIKLIGQIPDDCNLQCLPKWSRTASHLVPPPTTVETKMSESVQGVLDLALRWDPQSRGQWPAILALPFFRNPAGQAMRHTITPPTASVPTVTQIATSAGPPLPQNATPSRRIAAQVQIEQVQEGFAAAASNQVVPDLLPRCKCPGNCGSRLHKIRANSRYRHSTSDGDRSEVLVCTQIAVSPSQYCQRCQCERSGCIVARTKKKRWCMKHVCLDQAIKTQYITPKGPRSYPKKWPPKVRMMARMSFLFQFMEPDDLTVLRTFIREHDVLATGVLDPMRFAALFVAHLIKWPPAVAKWSDLLFENPLDRSTVAGLVSLLRRVIAWCHDRRWPDIFARMNSKLMDAQTGLAVNATRLGLIARCPDGTGLDEPKSRRIRTKSTEPGHIFAAAHPRGGEGRRYALGRAGSVYEELSDSGPAEAILQNLVVLTSAVALSVPQESVDVPAFADSLLTLINAARSYKSGNAHLKGGDSGYNSKHLLRVLLLEIECAIPDAWDTLSFRRLADWCPDETYNAEHLGDCTATFVRDNFATSPLMWHCWACLLGQNVDEAKVADALEMDDAVLWGPIWEHECLPNPEESFTPGPHIIWEAIERSFESGA